jgi:hypothetical protein
LTKLLSFAQSARDVTKIMNRPATIIEIPSIRPPKPMMIHPSIPESNADAAITHHILSYIVYFKESRRLGTDGRGLIFDENLNTQKEKFN